MHTVGRLRSTRRRMVVYHITGRHTRVFCQPHAGNNYNRFALHHIRLEFVEATDERFRISFMKMITEGHNNTTYKFALARFLLEYSRMDGLDTMVRYRDIARYFFRYYWILECKSKLEI